MPRFRFRGPLRVFNDTNERQAAYDPVGEEASETDRVHDGYKKIAHGYFDLDPGQSFTVPIAAADMPNVRGFEIRGTGDITIAINGATALQARRDVAEDDLDEDLLMFARVTVTGLVLALAAEAEEAVSGRWAFFGDPVS